MIALNTREMIKLKTMNEPVPRLRRGCCTVEVRTLSLVIRSHASGHLGFCLTIPADAFPMSGCDGVKVPLSTLCSIHIFLSRRLFAPSSKSQKNSIRFPLFHTDQLMVRVWCAWLQRAFLDPHLNVW